MATSTKEPSPSPAPVSAAPDAVAQTMALIQPWIEYIPAQQRRLGIFIFIALLAHIVVFFFIRIDATRAELRHQPRIHVTMENQPAFQREETTDNDFWNRYTDPRLFLLPQDLPGVSGADDLALDFTSLNPNIGSDDLPGAAPSEAYQFIHQPIVPLDQSVAGTMAPARLPFYYDRTPPSISLGTAWQWDDSLRSRQPSVVPELPSPVSDTELNPTELRLAIGPDGTVEHVLVEESCGSGRMDLDQAAVLAARKIRFKSTDQPGLTWGRATISWHYAPKPREEVVPTPPSTL